MKSSEVAERIEKALRERTGITYSVTAGRETAQSWIVIDIAVERRALETAAAEREALAGHMGFGRWDGTILVPGSEDARRDYLARAMGVGLIESEETLSSLLMPVADDPGRQTR